MFVLFDHLRLSQSLRFWSVTTLIVLGLLGWSGWSQYQDFHALQQQLARQTAHAAANDVEHFATAETTALYLFALQEAGRFATLIDHADDKEQQKQIWRLFKRRFPNIRSLAFANDHGQLQLALGGALNANALYEVRQYTRRAMPHPLTIQRTKEALEYRIIIPWYHDQKRQGVLFARFECGELCAILQNRPPKDHRLTLVLDGEPGIQPTRVRFPPITPVMAEANVASTRFRIFDELDNNVLRTKLGEIGMATGLRSIAFLAFALVLYGMSRQQEKKLLLKERRYQELLETSEDLIWTVDRNGYITWINEKAEEILGFPPSRMVGRPFIEFSSAEEVQRDLEAFHRVLDGQPLRHHVTRQKTANGQDVYLNYNAVPVKDRNGEIIGVTATASNVTSQIESLRALQDKEQRYRQMFELNHAVKLIIDAESGGILEANTAAAHFYHYPLDTLTTMNFGELSDLPSEYTEEQLRMARNDNVFSFQTRHRLADGDVRDVEISPGPVHYKDKRLIYLIITDVTERNRSERALRESEKKMRAILDSALEGVILSDENRRIKLFNPAAEIMFTRLSEDTLGKDIRELFPDHLDNENEHRLLRYFDSSESLPVSIARETVGLRTDGSQFPIHISLSSVDLGGKRHVVSLIQDLSEQKEHENQLNYLVQYDVLTGLLNRSEFERRLDIVLSSADLPDEQHVLCYIDIDQFKVINDTSSHTAGDELLKQMAVLLKSQLRETEVIARLGGDEFGALFTNCTLKRAEQICGGLMQTVRNFPFSWKEQSFEIAISIGLAGFTPRSESASSVLSAADVACHLAKVQGRNRVHVYQSTDIETVRQHGDMQLVPRITQALSDERFHLYIQPIAPVGNIDDDSSYHYEVLVRMIDESGELVIPDAFVPAAERYILMPAIDRWIINHLFSTQGDTLRAWAKRNGGRHAFLFAVNLSGTSLTDEGFLSYIKRHFRDWDIPYSSICFEITETAVVANLSKARQLIEELKTLGCSFALDDFGSGLSSYGYLKELPVDYLKIDGSFVRHMTDDPVDHAMVDSINQIAHILGLKTIAEWAEDKATLNLLRALNVDFAQGYGVGAPQDLDQFILPGRLEEEVNVGDGR